MLSSRAEVIGAAFRCSPFVPVLPLLSVKLGRKFIQNLTLFFGTEQDLAWFIAECVPPPFPVF
jgi:hypothetical protein